MENEIKRLNSEINDLISRKKKDEEEIVKEWKNKIAAAKEEYERSLQEIDNSKRYLNFIYNFIYNPIKRFIFFCFFIGYFIIFLILVSFKILI